MMSFSHLMIAFGVVFVILMVLSLVCVLALSYGLSHLPAKPEQKLTWSVVLRGAEKSFMIFGAVAVVAILLATFALSAA